MPTFLMVGVVRFMQHLAALLFMGLMATNGCSKVDSSWRKNTTKLL